MFDLRGVQREHPLFVQAKKWCSLCNRHNSITVMVCVVKVLKLLSHGDFSLQETFIAGHFPVVGVWFYY